MRTERTLTHPSLGGNGFIAVDYNLSKMNHRLYRQSKCYYGTVTMNQINPGDEVEIYTLNDNWMLEKAYKHAMETYFNSRQLELEAAGNNKARWGDFRVTPGHLTGSAWTDPVDPVQYAWIQTVPPTAQTYTAGEYLYSMMLNDSGVMQGFTLGTEVTTATTTHHPFLEAWNIFTEYQKNQNTQASPESTTVSLSYASSDIVNEQGGEDVEIQNVLQDGNEPPYNPDTVVGDPWVQRAVLGSNSTGTNSIPSTKISTGLIPIPLGLVMYNINGTANITINLKAGDYKGVRADDMGTPKLVGGKKWVVR